MATSTVPILDYVPVGFRFRPTDEELVDHYLKHKLEGDEFTVQIIPDIDLCKVEPWDMPAYSKIKSDDPEWFFFSPRDYKYAKSTRSNRATEQGFWKVTGQDRHIKVRGTNNVIGSKKTLVFYKGRVPHGVKTNWVIHEYHATTFDVNQRTFFLCRLMKKPERKAVVGTDAISFDGGEPSCHMASECEGEAPAEINPDESNLEIIFPTPPQPSSPQRSPIGIGWQPSFPNSPFQNGYVLNEDISMHVPFETTEEEGDVDEFLNTIWGDGDFLISEERAHTFANGSNQSDSLRRVYYESSDTDAEVVSARYGNVVKISAMHGEHDSSRDYRAAKMVQSSHGAVHGLSPNQELNKKMKQSIARDDFWGVESSSCDSNADKPVEMNFVEISSSPSTLRRGKNQYHPRPDNLVSQRNAARRSLTQRKVSSNAVSHLEDKKELAIMESKKDQEKAQNVTSSRRNLETRSCQPSDVNGKSYFICMKTPLSSQSQFPPSVYLVNVVIGILLFIVISWVVLLC